MGNGVTKCQICSMKQRSDVRTRLWVCIMRIYMRVFVCEQFYDLRGQIKSTAHTLSAFTMGRILYEDERVLYWPILNTHVSSYSIYWVFFLSPRLK